MTKPFVEPTINGLLLDIQDGDRVDQKAFLATIYRNRPDEPWLDDLSPYRMLSGITRPPINAACFSLQGAYIVDEEGNIYEVMTPKALESGVVQGDHIQKIQREAGREYTAEEMDRMEELVAQGRLPQLYHMLGLPAFDPHRQGLDNFERNPTENLGFRDVGYMADDDMLHPSGRVVFSAIEPDGHQLDLADELSFLLDQTADGQL